MKNDELYSIDLHLVTTV